MQPELGPPPHDILGAFGPFDPRQIVDLAFAQTCAEVAPERPPIPRLAKDPARAKSICAGQPARFALPEKWIGKPQVLDPRLEFRGRKRPAGQRRAAGPAAPQ